MRASVKRPSLGPATTSFLLLAALLLPTLLAQGDLTRRDELERLDDDARRWVEETLDAMSLDAKVGQLVLPSLRSVYTSSDSAVYDDLTTLVHEQRVGGFHVFGSRQAAPDVLLNPAYARTVLGQPLAAASILNRLQAISPIPLLMTADFETGVGFRMTGATTFPRAMAFGAAGNPQLAFDAGRITAVESRAIGVHLNFAPVVDVNNNPRNPVINTRSFGEDPSRVAELAVAYVRGLQAGGMLATVKHFPGHGDTDVDSHLGLPIIRHPRARLEAVELPPFRRAIAAGTDGVMTAHIELPALDPSEGTPTTFSEPIVTTLLRGELGFDGLVFTDSMRMRAVTEMVTPAEAAGRAVAAGHDVVLHSPDDRAAVDGIKAALRDGRLSDDALDRSVRRVLTAKARLGLHRRNRVDLETLPLVVGTRAHEAVARRISEQSITLIKDERSSVPLRIGRDRSLLYLSMLDYPSGWGLGAPSRIVIPELEKRWSSVTAIELSDRSSRSEIELVRETAGRYDAVVAGVFVRTASFSGRMDLADDLVGLLRDVAADAERHSQPLVVVFFGNPYAATFLPELPSVLLTYDYRDLAEESAVRALAGEIAVAGRLPIALGDEFPVGHGLTRPVLGGAP